MRCFHPIACWRVAGQKQVVFNKPPVGDNLGELSIACGRCIGCRLRRAESWVVRCLHEKRMHEHSCAVTLTYDDEHVPHRGQLVYSHFQEFMRKARRKLGPFRFYCGGEYGSENGRPHFHACLFGVRFGDRKFFKRAGDGSDLFTSETLSMLWGRGHTTVGDLSAASAGYIARYIVAKVNGDLADEHYLRCDEFGEAYWLEPEFSRMSLKPGIGYTFWEKYKEELLVRDGCVIDGKVMRMPKYYDRLLEELDSDRQEEVEKDRIIKASRFAEDCTEARLAVQEVVAKARLKLKKRGNV